MKEKIDTVKCKNCGAELKVLEIKHIDFLNRDIVVKEECENCKKLEIEKSKEEIDKKFHQQVEDNVKKANIPKKYKDIHFDDLNPQTGSYNAAKEGCINFCKAAKDVIHKGYGIYLVGDKGTGKTSLICAIMNELLKLGYSCYFLSMGEIKTNLYKNLITIEMLENIDFLFCDDFGTEKYVNSQNNNDTWINEKIYEFINYRYNYQKSTLFSSNIDFDELEDKGLFPKTVDRVYEMSTRIFKIEMEKSLRLKRSK